MSFYLRAPDQAELDLWAQTGTDPAEDAIEARDEAIDRAERHADRRYMDEALLAIWRVAKTQERLTSLDVAPLIGMEPHEPRALGAAFRKAKANGWLVPAGYVPSASVRAHARPVREWVSRIYGVGEL